MVPANATAPVFNGNTVTPTIPTFSVRYYGGCNGGDDTAAINSAISAAVTAGGGVVDGRGCTHTISGPLNVTGSHITFDFTGATINVASSYAGDVFKEPYTSPIVDDKFENIYLNYQGTPASGAAFDIQFCDGCTFDHIKYSGQVFNLFAFGVDQAGDVFSRTVVNDVRSVNAGAGLGKVAGTAMLLTGQIVNLSWSHSLIFGGVNSGSAWFTLNDSAATNGARIDTLNVFDVDYEFTTANGNGFNVTLVKSGDYFANADIEDNLCDGAPNYCFNASISNTGQASGTNKWIGNYIVANGSTSANGIVLSATGTNTFLIRDIIASNNFQAGTASGVDISLQNAGVRGTQINGNAGGLGYEAVYNGGYFTHISGNNFANTGNGGFTNVVENAATALVCSITANNFDSNTTGILTDSGASTCLITSNDLKNVTTPVSTSASASGIIVSNNAGYSPAMSSVTGSLWSVGTQAGTQSAVDTSGDAQFAGTVYASGFNSAAFTGGTFMGARTGAFFSNRTATNQQISMLTMQTNGTTDWIVDEQPTSNPQLDFFDVANCNCSAMDLSTGGTLTLRQNLIANTGVQPNGSSGAYAAENFPLGASETHPKWLSGTCAVTSPNTACTFPNSFAFADTTYVCTVTAQGTTPIADSYAATSTTSITIYAGTSATFSYTCLR